MKSKECRAEPPKPKREKKLWAVKYHGVWRMAEHKYWSYEEAAREVFGIYAGIMMEVKDLGPRKDEAVKAFKQLKGSANK